MNQKTILLVLFSEATVKKRNPEVFIWAHLPLILQKSTNKITVLLSFVLFRIFICLYCFKKIYNLFNKINFNENNTDN